LRSISCSIERISDKRLHDGKPALPLCKIASVLMRHDHITRFIVDVNQGVTSNAHANTSAAGKPRANSTTNACSSHSGTWKLGSTVNAIRIPDSTGATFTRSRSHTALWPGYSCTSRHLQLFEIASVLVRLESLHRIPPCTAHVFRTQRVRAAFCLEVANITRRSGPLNISAP
jgi:hypothetical protein